jgi:hypothetical protein
MVGERPVIEQVTRALHQKQVRFIPFTGAELREQAVHVIYNPNDMYRLREISGYATIIVFPSPSIVLPELPDECFVVEIITTQPYRQPVLLQKDVEVKSTQAYDQRLYSLGYFQRAVSSFLAYDLDYIYDDKHFIQATNMAKISTFVNLVTQSGGARFLLLSAQPLADTYNALLAAGVICIHAQIVGNVYVNRNVPDNTQVILQEYDPLVGQVNAFNIDYFWPGPRRVYLMETPINSLALNFLNEMDWIQPGVTVLTAKYKNSQTQTTDNYFAQRMRKLYFQ